MRPVLLVEDEHETREALMQILRGAGFPVLASDEGRKALELAVSIRPCAIVLDLVMQGMNGWEFLDRRKHVPELASTPVVVISGADTSGLDAAAVLTKPFTTDDLVATVRRVVDRRPRGTA